MQTRATLPGLRFSGVPAASPSSRTTVGPTFVPCRSGVSHPVAGGHPFRGRVCHHGAEAVRLGDIRTLDSISILVVRVIRTMNRSLVTKMPVALGP